MHSFLIQGFSVLFVFISSLLMVRASDPDSYGSFVNIFNWVSILGVVVLGGRDDLVLAELPRYRSERQAQLVRLVRSANCWVLLAGLVAGFGLFAFLGVVPMIAVYLTAALGLNQLVLQALDHIRLSQVIEKLVKPLLLVGGVLLLRSRFAAFDTATLVDLSSVVLGICCVIVFYLVFRALREYGGGSRGPGNEVSTKEAQTDEKPTNEALTNEASGRLTGKTFWFFVISLFTLLSTRITMLIMPGHVSSPKDIGIFNISYRFADLLIFPFFLMHAVLPQLFARHAGTGRVYTQSLYSESNKLMVLLSLPLLVVNVAAGPFLLKLFGHDFSSGYAAMVYISLAQFLFSLFGPANTILMMQDREKHSAGCLVVYVSVLAATSWWLIPAESIGGGAIAILISSAVYNILLAVVVYRLFGVRSPFLGWLLPRRI
jgi:O-antigen/teichoic acid export membrane protein